MYESTMDAFASSGLFFFSLSLLFCFIFFPFLSSYLFFPFFSFSPFPFLCFLSSFLTFPFLLFLFFPFPPLSLPSIPLGARIIKNPDVSTGPLAHPFTPLLFRSFSCTAHSFARSLTSLTHFAHTQAHGKVDD